MRQVFSIHSQLQGNVRAMAGSGSRENEHSELDGEHERTAPHGDCQTPISQSVLTSRNNLYGSYRFIDRVFDIEHHLASTC
jgi:hypothetical protein